MNNYTTFRVIKIIDEYNIVINGGINDDISLKDEIEIFIKGDEIFDPYNDNKSLGTLDFIKETLTVTQASLDFSVCQKIIKTETHTPSPFQASLMNSLTGISKLTNGITKVETSIAKLNVKSDEITGGLIKGDKTIVLGDFARISLSS